MDIEYKKELKLLKIADLVFSGSVRFVDGPATVRTAVVLEHQEFVILTVKHL